jgi:hypothetical protein
MVSDDDGPQAGLPERALDEEDVPDEACLRELDPIVDLVALHEEILGQRIEKIECVELLPGQGGHVGELKVRVRHSELEARALRHLDEVRALLDTNEIELRRSARGREHELSAAGADIENATCTSAVQEIRRATGDSDGRPKASRKKPDARRVHGIEGFVISRVGIRNHHRCRPQASNVPHGGGPSKDSRALPTVTTGTKRDRMRPLISYERPGATG